MDAVAFETIHEIVPGYASQPHLVPCASSSLYNVVSQSPDWEDNKPRHLRHRPPNDSYTGS